MTLDVHWYLEWIQTEETCPERLWKRIDDADASVIPEPIGLISLNESKLFWARCGFRLFYFEVFCSNEKTYMICNLQDHESYRRIHETLYPGEDTDDGWHASLCLSGELLWSEYTEKHSDEADYVIEAIRDHLSVSI